MNRLIHSQSGKRAVAIFANEDAGPYTACLYVNCNPVLQTHAGLGDITPLRKKAAKMVTIEAWATEQLKEQSTRVVSYRTEPACYSASL